MVSGATSAQRLSAVKVIVWNMAGKPSNWRWMQQEPELADADLALLSEAPRAPRVCASSVDTERSDSSGRSVGTSP
jgi:hypothetical protein